MYRPTPVRRHNLFFISYYGGKASIARYYPKPLYPVIVEPFAGSAAYSLYHRCKDVILVEKNPDIAEMWRFIISGEIEEWLPKIPRYVQYGDQIDEFFHSAPRGLQVYLGSIANTSTGGTGIRKTVSMWAASIWSKKLTSLELALPIVRNWRIIAGNYDKAPDIVATWFIDPPYLVSPGKRYKYSEIDYNVLREWIHTRRGQIIVCGAINETWLPFKPLGIYGSRLSEHAEAIYTFLRP